MKLGIIGGGIVGLATAYRLQKAFPQHKILLFEKEAQPGRHQSTHNSGVLHAGLYYKPGSLKANLSVKGIRQMKAFCEKNNIPHDSCGKLVVATTKDEVVRLKTLFERGSLNGLKGLAMLDVEAMKEIEPHVSGVGAVRVPEEGIVDFGRVCKTLAEKINSHNGELHLDYKVISLERTSNGWIINRGESNAVEVDFIINTAGLHSDRVCLMAGKKPKAKIVPFRGEYFKINQDRSYLVNHLIYPVPDPKFPFLGVHFTRLIHGGIEAGPNAVLALSREGYKKTDFNFVDTMDSISFPGLWKFGTQHFSMCCSEILRSMSKSLFCKALQRLVPEVQLEDLSDGGAGVRAQAMTPNGKLEQDFVIERGDGVLHVLNAPSPGATASLAIADYLIHELTEHWDCFKGKVETSHE